jgi:hypothetical protein
MSQCDDEGVLHPVAYISDIHTSAKCNYNLYHKVLMTIIKAHEQCWPGCDGDAYHLQLIADQKHPKYVMTQVLWNQTLDSGVTYSLVLINEQTVVWGNGTAKWMHWWGYQETSLSRGDERLQILEYVGLKLQNLPEQLRFLVPSLSVKGHPPISDLFKEASEIDLWPGRILEAIEMNGSVKEITVADWMAHTGRIGYWGKEYYPDSDLLQLSLIHDLLHNVLSGHLGRVKTFDVVHRQ